jgi:phage terminase large subunit-like protein
VTEGFVELRPLPWGPHPYGPYRVLGDGRIERFRSQGPRVIQWIERNCVFPSDRWLGEPFVLQAWQKQLLVDLFEEVWDDELGRWRRRYRTALIGLPKKQGKTTLVAALAVYFLLGAREPDPRIAVAAAAENQADLVFGAARTMVERSPRLRQFATPFAREIQRKDGAGWIRRVPANGGKFDGQNLLVGIGDELHEWDTPNQRKMHGMISGAFATREEPLHICITTAGVDEPDEDDELVAPWLRMYRYGRRLEAGELADPSFMFRWWSADPDADPRDLASYADLRVNPSFGTTVREDFYRAEFGKRTESEMRRYYLNQPVESVNTWLDHGMWEACNVGPFELDVDAPTWIGWDASSKRDSTAVVVIQRRRDATGRRRVFVTARVWERPVGPDGAPEEGWRVPRREVLDYVVGLFERLRNVRGCGYDPAFIAWLVEELEDRGLPMVEVPQTDQRMMPATQALYDLILAAQPGATDPEAEALAHDGDPVLARHIRAARAKMLPRGGERLVKARSGVHFDAAIALVMAVYLAGEAEEEPRGISVYIPGEDDDA